MHDTNRGITFDAIAQHALKSLISGVSVVILLASSCSQSAQAGTETTDSSQPNELKSQKKPHSGTFLALSPTGEKVGECPLEHTSVDAKISGYVASVTVKQEFRNPYNKKIEAIYAFPLSATGTVDDMTMQVNGRVIHGKIKTREEARKTYEETKSAEQMASLLDQGDNNIFTQSVANIEPGKSIITTLHYVELLPFESGKFTFTFPMVVASRSIPGMASGPLGTERAKPTKSSPGASKITPPVTPESTRSGHDISIDVDIEGGAGLSVTGLSSQLHSIKRRKISHSETIVSLSNKNEISNQDFVLSWNASGDQMNSGYLTHKDPQAKDGFFTLMLMPPKKPAQDMISPKEMIFLVDLSGSQDGAALEKTKETLKYIIDHMNPNDTFQIIAFGKEPRTLFEKPETVSPSMQKQALKFIDSLESKLNEGTFRAPAVERVLSMPNDAHRLRIVIFMTDGYMGCARDVLGLIHKYRSNSRWFPFGIGYGVNRAFIDGIANEGGGEADLVHSNSSPMDVARKFYKRIAAPVLTDVKIDFGDLKVTDVYPHEGDVWAACPLYFHGRYTQPGSGKVTLSGSAGGKPYKETLNVTLPDQQPKNDVLAPLWAIAKIDRLMSENYLGSLDNEPGYEGGGGGSAPDDLAVRPALAAIVPEGNVNEQLKNEITQLGLQHHIMTNYTSFVAVEEKRVTKGGAAGSVEVPVVVSDRVRHRRNEQMPLLQGATNGTIGPQGADATFVTGVNIAGTVRVNNLANLEALLNILANAGQLLGILAGSLLAIRSIGRRTYRRLRPAAQFTIGLLLIVGGLVLPGCVNYLVACARDANLFN